MCIKITFHPTLKQLIIIINEVKQGDNFAETFTKRVKFAKHVVLREAEWCLTRYEGLAFDCEVRGVVNLI
jgi:hypothetical protein